MLKRNKAWYIKIFGFNINIIYFFGFAVTIYFISSHTDYLIKLKNNYFCPLGEEKYSINDLKEHKTNLELLKVIEIQRDNLNKQSKKVAEDDEYEYFVLEEGSSPTEAKTPASSRNSS